MKSFKLMGALIIVLGMQGVYGMKEEVMQPIASADSGLVKRALEVVNTLKNKAAQSQANNYIAQLRFLNYKTAQQQAEGKRILGILAKMGLKENVSYQEKIMNEKIALVSKIESKGNVQPKGMELSKEQLKLEIEQLKDKVMLFVPPFFKYANESMDDLKQPCLNLFAKIADQDNCWVDKKFNVNCVQKNEDLDNFCDLIFVIMMRLGDGWADWFKTAIEPLAKEREADVGVLKDAIRDNLVHPKITNSIIPKLEELTKSVHSEQKKVLDALVSQVAWTLEDTSPSLVWIELMKTLYNLQKLLLVSIGDEHILKKMKEQEVSIGDGLDKALDTIITGKGKAEKKMEIWKKVKKEIAGEQ